MHYLPPRPWAQIEPGTVVTLGVPRTVLSVSPSPLIHPGMVIVLLEGVDPLIVPAADFAYPVELDAADAIGNLHTTGLHPTPAPTEGNPS